ncbi:hypothetical protein [Nonomuraea sp. NPDC050310]|uniref:hypothetical protein n=1 Tax=Nonomuraea sp. NPDC050310 TaxID=3154935 RepID=UPI0033D0D3BB
MIIKRAALAALVASAGLLAVPAPALAAPPTPEQLESALLVPEDFGFDFGYNETHNREVLSAGYSKSKGCKAALKALTPLFRAKTATWISRNERPEGVKEVILAGKPKQIDALEAAAKVMSRECRGTIDNGASKRSFQRLSVGKLGDAVYAFRFISRIPEISSEVSMGEDVVVIRRGDTLIGLTHNGFFGSFQPSLTQKAARLAATRLDEVLATG